MQAYTDSAPAVEITPADRAWAAAALATEEYHDLDSTTPAEVLAEPNPRDGWPQWVDEDCWETGESDLTDADWDRIAEERYSIHGDGWPTDRDMAEFRPL